MPDFATIAIEAIAAEPLTVHLYVNKLTPNRGTILADFEEMIEAGYKPREVTGKVTDGAIEYKPALFYFNAPFDKVIGYYATDSKGELQFNADGTPVAERFDKPLSSAKRGGRIEVVLRM